MATFQSQINILAAANCNIHKRIADLENNQISVKYCEESTEFYMGSEMGQIKYLGYRSYEAIVYKKGGSYYVMDYTGIHKELEHQSLSLYINLTPINYGIQNGKIELKNGTIQYGSGDNLYTLTNTYLNIIIGGNSGEIALAANNIIYGSDNICFITTSNSDKGGLVNNNFQFSIPKDKYIEIGKYTSVKFINFDDNEQINSDQEWELPKK